MRRILQRLIGFFREDPGQDLVEYSLLIAFMAMAAIGIFSQTGRSIQGPWSNANTTLATANGNPVTAVAPPNGGGGGGGDGDGGHGH